MAERCLVVGGGLIGSRVAAALADSGRPVTVLSRSFNRWLTEHSVANDGVALVEGTIDSSPHAAELVAEADIVFFLAGSSTPQLADADEAASVAGLLTPAVSCLAHMVSSGTRRLVMASSGGTVYGRTPPLPTPESAPTEPISVHGVNSVATEQYALLHARRGELEPIILRYSNVYGPGQLARRGLGVIAAWCEAIAGDRPVTVMGDGGTRRDFIYADDAGSATVEAAFGAPRPGIYNVGTGESASLTELLRVLADTAGRPPRVEHLPPRPMDVPATELDCSRLRSATGWRPGTSLEAGVRLCWQWTLAHRPPA